MRCITKEKTALFIPNAIAIITSKKEYIFRSFWDREDAFKTLKQCQQHANGAAQSAHSAPAVRSPAAEAEGPSPSREGSLDLGSRYVRTYVHGRALWSTNLWESGHGAGGRSCFVGSLLE